MKMIAVGGVVLRPQGGVEAVTGGAMHLAQELALLSRFRPVAPYADMPTVTQAETDDIQRIGRGMLALPLATGDGATGVTADMLDPRHRLAEHRLRGRLQTRWR